LEENIPIDFKILKEFMKCGYVYGKTLYPTINGTLQGGTISPTLEKKISGKFVSIGLVKVAFLAGEIISCAEGKLGEDV